MGEMTNKQAARWLKDLLKSDLPMEQYQTALEKGIEALEQEPCNTDTCKVAKAYMNEWDKPNNSDEISRQAVLDITWEEPSYTDPLNVLTEIRDKIKDLPSVNPQEPKTGHWEYVQYDYNPKIGNWHCSECRCVVVECVNKEEEGGIPLYKYCPQCGARMEDKE